MKVVTVLTLAGGVAVPVACVALSGAAALVAADWVAATGLAAVAATGRVAVRASGADWRVAVANAAAKRPLVGYATCALVGSCGLVGGRTAGGAESDVGRLDVVVEVGKVVCRVACEALIDCELALDPADVVVEPELTEVVGELVVVLDGMVDL